jgi:hypothetical protein
LGSSLPRHEGHLAGHHTLPNNEVKTVIIPWNYMNIVRTLWISEFFQKFRKLNVLTLQSQYIFSLLCFVIMNRDQYKLNPNIHSRNTRQSSNFHVAISNLTLYQRGNYHMGFKIYNRLPAYIKNISHNDKEFKLL